MNQLAQHIAILSLVLAFAVSALPLDAQAVDSAQRFQTTNTAENSLEASRPNQITYDTVLGQLNNPCGIAIQPETGHVFVADSGHRRVIRVVDGKLEEVIIDFSRDYFGKGPFYEIGPLSLLFLDENRLLVGSGGHPDGEDRIAVFEIPPVGGEPIKADQFAGAPFTLPKSDDTPPEGDFFGLARVGDNIFVTCNGNDKKSWISVATVEEGKLTSFERSIALKPETRTSAPTGITVSPEGYLAVAQMGAIDGDRDSRLTFCNPYTGEVTVSFKTGSQDLTGLAYGPKRGRLFATDFNWADTKQGALVKLVALGPKGCESRRLLTLEKPTALCFAPNGDLYITLAGNTSEGRETPDGKLIVVKGLDDEPGEEK